MGDTFEVQATLKTKLIEEGLGDIAKAVMVESISTPIVQDDTVDTIATPVPTAPTPSPGQANATNVRMAVRSQAKDVGCLRIVVMVISLSVWVTFVVGL